MHYSRVCHVRLRNILSRLRHPEQKLSNQESERLEMNERMTILNDESEVSSKIILFFNVCCFR